MTNCQGNYGCAVAAENGGAPAVTGSSMTSIYSAVNGAGIYLDAVNAVITTCILNHCEASDSGGGIASINGASPTLAHCIISNCLATTSGAGVYSAAGPSTMTFTNCAIHDNTCSNTGGGVFFNVGCDAVFLNCTIANNTAGGNAGGLYSNQCTIDLTDCIIWGNSCGSFGNQLMAAGTTADTLVTFDYCCLPSNAQDPGRFAGGGTITELGTCVNADPLFWTGTLGDYYLSQVAAGQGSDTPCLDVGSDTAANLGLEGKTTRTDNVTDTAAVDIGYHYNP